MPLEVNAEKLREKTLETIHILSSDLDPNYYIPTGIEPFSIQVVYNELDRQTVYVANFDSDSISIMDGNNDTKIAADILIDEPRDLEVDGNSNTVFVLSTASPDKVFMVDGNNTKLSHDSIPTGVDSIALAINDTSTMYKEGVILYVVGTEKSESPVNGKLVIIKVREGKKEYENGTEVGINPRAVEIDPKNNLVYVANTGNNSVSVFNATTKNVTATIPVGMEPRAIGIDSNRSFVYVANTGNNSVSVINTTSLNVTKNITVGIEPISILVYEENGSLYVANNGSNSVSVINTTSLNVTGSITVGQNPLDLAIDTVNEKIYVANSGSRGVSIIDPISNSLKGGFIFDIVPFNSGRIECGGLIAPTLQHFYINTNTTCTAIPNKGFDFSSWTRNLEGNSTQLVKIPQSFPTIFDNTAAFLDYSANFFAIKTHLQAIVDFFAIKPYLNIISEFFSLRSPETEATLNVTEFGSYTATFKAVPAPLPLEYWTALFSVIITALIGSWLIPTLINKMKTKSDVRKLTYYHRRIKKLCDDGKLDQSDIESLDTLKTDITDAYSKGKINEKHYERLNNEICILYDKIFRK